MLPPAMTEHGGKNPEMGSRRIGPIQLENLDGVLTPEGSMQTSSGRPNEAVDPQMYPSSQPPSTRSAKVALAGFILLSGAGALIWLAI